MYIVNDPIVSVPYYNVQDVASLLTFMLFSRMHKFIFSELGSAFGHYEFSNGMDNSSTLSIS